VEGTGTLELASSERDDLHRIDVRELNAALLSLARYPVLSAFRYQHSAGAAPPLSLAVTRFADAGVLAAVAERATATTLVTVEGRTLTEVALWVQNRAQPFLKVTLPTGASIVSVEVAGESAKPVLGADGTRVPLLRPGFRPSGPYAVSFVYVHGGTPLTNKGVMPMTLPKMDMPIGFVEWEVFVPDRYRVRHVDGNVIPARVVDMESAAVGVPGGTAGGVAGGVAARVDALSMPAKSGQIVGRAVDASGRVLPGVTVDVDAGGARRTATTGSDGVFVISNVPSGPVDVNARLEGFGPGRRSFIFDQRPRRVDFVMNVAGVTETVTVMADAPVGEQPQTSSDPVMRREVRPLENEKVAAQAAPSQNVVNLQRRAAGVLPVHVDVPRAGTSHRFVKALVVDEEPKAMIAYVRR
jgi:hypothetical protein